MSTQAQPQTDGGPGWVQQLGVNGAPVTSADASSTPLVITDAPHSGKRIVLDDLELSVDTKMTLTLRTVSDHQIIGYYHLAADSFIQVTTRGLKRAPAANRALELLASAAGNVWATALYHQG
jgi:hypothetical protein